MSGPTIGIGRITIPYTVDGLAHVSRMYVSEPTLSGSDWVVSLRPSVGGTLPWDDVAEHFSQTLSYILETGTTVGSALLEEYSATGWLPRATASVSMPNLSGNANIAAEAVLTLRDSNFTRPKIVVMEHNQVAPTKFTSPTGGAGGLDSFIAEFLSTGTLGGRPWVAMVNQHGFFLSESPFVSVTTTYNRKLRRARGLA
jgi:hypothetical protein